MKLLVLADDLTGSLDTGIQFAQYGASTRVVLNAEYPLNRIDPSVQILVINTESRHASPKRAAEIVGNIVRQAVALKIPYIYKKTDSALRGNLGAELGAALSESGEEQLHFIPAFPKMKRGTVKGIHYIDGVPVAESVFGKDPFNPVTHSNVKDILHEQTDLPVYSVPLEAPIPSERGIMVYDALTEEEVLARGRALKAAGKLALLSGCAGFASILADLLDLRGDRKASISYAPDFLVVCGSVNPITVAQLAYAEEKGFTHLYVTAEEALTPHWFTTEAGGKKLDEWASLISRNRRCIIDTNDRPGYPTAGEYAAKAGIAEKEIPTAIARAMGEMILGLIRRGVDATMLITGGDTLMGFMRSAGISAIVPVKELVTGSVLSTINVEGKDFNIISKSGGFGQEDLIMQIDRIVLPK
jgi:uncharacterized protein YgbK (DUF1537 family)